MKLLRYIGVPGIYSGAFLPVSKNRISVRLVFSCTSSAIVSRDRESQQVAESGLLRRSSVRFLDLHSTNLVAIHRFFLYDKPSLPRSFYRTLDGLKTICNTKSAGKTLE